MKTFTPLVTTEFGRRILQLDVFELYPKHRSLLLVLLARSVLSVLPPCCHWKNSSQIALNGPRSCVKNWNGFDINLFSRSMDTCCGLVIDLTGSQRC
jgi:hypothetical protein